MYQEHLSFRLPPLKAKLWRYMDLTRLIAILQTRPLFFPRVDRLEDRWEGSVSKGGLSSLDARLSQLPGPQAAHAGNAILALICAMRLRTCISCRHANKLEFSVMWRLNSTGNAGMAGETTVGRLHDCLKHAVPPHSDLIALLGRNNTGTTLT
jgi:hypothetical protein